ncbi:MAG: histidine--tRNA ligase, partial [Candidatus Omnitrophota bacterium]
MFKAPRGTKDILPEESYKWQNIENIGRKIFSLYGYQEIRTPVIEDIELFKRSLGAHTEVVEKQMFVIPRDEENYVLRPEATASIVRAYLENSLENKAGFSKFFYIGPMFRAERPQKGRLRQFHHLGVEAIGAKDPYLDAEVINLATKLLLEFGIDGYEFKLNTLGCPEDKKKFAEILRKVLKNEINHFCPDCQNRYTRNVFRILDCKNEACRALIQKIKIDYKEYLCKDCLSYFQDLKNILDFSKIKYIITPHLVRGLDYYTGTVFEISHPDLGSQDALGAGGRYDGLIKELGGKEIPAIGFAFGMERLLLVKSLKVESLKERPNLNTYLITLGQKTKAKGFILLDQMRSAGISCEMDYENKSLKAQLRKANDLGVDFVIILGEDELKKDTLILKNMVS